MSLFLRSVQLDNFRTYAAGSSVSGLESGATAIVGRNGSGKSNLFTAIKFVLDTDLSIADCRPFIRQAEDNPSHTCSVTLELANDGAIPTRGETVFVKKLVHNAKTISYYVDGTETPSAVVRDMLASAGLPTGTKYNIIEQGTIIAQGEMPPPDRLALLLAAAGAEEFDRRRAETLERLAAADQRMASTRETMDSIHSRITALEQAAGDFETFSALQRRADAATTELAYRQRAAASAELADRTTRAAPVLSDAAARAATLADATLSRTNLTNELAAAEIELSPADAARDAAATTAAAAARAAAAADAELASATARLNAVTETQARDRARARTLATELQAAEEAAATLAAEREQAQGEIVGLVEAVASAEAAETTVPPTEAEWVLQTSARLAAAEAEQQDAEAALADALAVPETVHHVDSGAELAAAREAVAAARAAETRQRLAATRARDTLGSANARLMNADAALATASDAVTNARTTMFSKTMLAVSDGVAAVRALVQEENSRRASAGERRLGVISTVIEALGDIDTSYYPALEAVAGNQLYHIITDNDATAREVLDLLRARARADKTRYTVTFKPLAQLAPELTPAPAGERATPLLDLLPNVRADVLPAIQAVFGRALLVPSIEDGARIAQLAGCDCVTVSGDLIGRRGEITGGFADGARLHAARLWRRARAAENAARRDRAAAAVAAEHAAAAAAAAEDEFAAAVDAAAEADAAAHAAENAAQAAAQESVVAVQREEVRRKTILAAEASVGAARARAAAARSQLVGGYEAAVAAAAAAAAAGGRAALQRRLDAARETVHTTTVRLDAARQTAVLAREDLARIPPDHGVDTSAADAAREAATAATAARATAEAAAAAAEAAAAAAHARVESLQQQLAAAEAAEAAAQQSVDELSREAVSLRVVIDALEARIADLDATIGRSAARDLALARETDSALSASVRELRAEMRRLEMRGINVQAVQQHAGLVSDRDALQAQMATVEEGRVAIEEMVKDLALRRDEELTGAYTRLCTHFSEFFTRLAGGRGELFLTDTDGNELSAGTPAAAAHGIGVRASFSAEGVLMDLATLSGGQRTLLAVAFVFALQRTSPAPICILDEVDAALDEVYRTALASLVHDVAQGLQIFSVSFRPELVATADHWLLVTMQHRCSQCRHADRSVAMEVIEAEQRDASEHE